MPTIPAWIVLRRHRDLVGRRHQVWVRRGILLVLALVPLLGLVNVFGQHSSTATASAPAATLTLHAPARVRGGLIYEARFTIRARQDLRHPALLPDSDWLKGMTLNTLEPSPVEETSENGSVRFDFGTIPSGQRFDVFLQYQVNPTSLGRREQRAELLDRDTVITSIDRTLLIFP